MYILRFSKFNNSYLQFIQFTSSKWQHRAYQISRKRNPTLKIKQNSSSKSAHVVCMCIKSTSTLITKKTNMHMRICMYLLSLNYRLLAMACLFMFKRMRTKLAQINRYTDCLRVYPNFNQHRAVFRSQVLHRIRAQGESSRGELEPHKRKAGKFCNSVPCGRKVERRGEGRLMKVLRASQSFP